MNKLRVLWLSNTALSGPDTYGTGSWLFPMARRLIESGRIELGNITQGRVRQCRRSDYPGLAQWIIPRRFQFIGEQRIPGPRRIEEILSIIDQFSPDIIHVWGTEQFWGLLISRRIIRLPALLEMQGLEHACALYYEGGLSLWDQMACIGFKEIAKISPIFMQRRRLHKWGVFEQEIIRGHKFIGIQSEWIMARVKAINPNCLTFQNDIILRDQFYAEENKDRPRSHVLFCSAAYPVPYKGIHVAIRAAALLKNRFPDIQLRIAGPYQREGVRQDGYVRWLKREIKRLGLTHNIVWLGEQSAGQIIKEMQSASAMIIPSFIENCCVAMQEAMNIGIPLVVSYSGGLPSLADHEISALFFPAGDEVICAHQIERLLTDQPLADRLSREAHTRATKRNDPDRIIKRQIRIYEQILGSHDRPDSPLSKANDTP